LNRGAVEEVEFDHSHIAGGLSKINTADNVFGIFTSRAMRERGRYQLQLMKTRSSSGVGMKVDLEFNVETLRITDLGEEGQQGYNAHQPSANQIKANASPKIQDDGKVEPAEQGETKKVTAEIQSSKLKSLLNQIKTQ